MHIIIAGDFVPFGRTAIQVNQGDFSCFDEVKPIIQAADYSIVNLESPVVSRDANPIEKTGPNLRCTERAVECAVSAGFKCVTLANNHFRDYGQIGVEDTLTACHKYGIDFVGGGKDIKEAQKVHYKTIGDKKLAIVNMCENEWSIASSNYGGSNPLNPIQNYYSIVEARNNADYVVVIVHGGIEHYQLPSPRMVETYRFFIDIGADTVVNHHQHCYSGYEVYKNKPIFYGIGNFCFDNKNTVQNHQKDNRLWEEGFMVNINLNETISFNLIPYRQCDEEKAIVRLLKDRGYFDDNIEKINIIIADKMELIRHFEFRAKKGIDYVNNVLSPYSSTLAKRLASRSLLPSFIDTNRTKRLLGYIQCESHRDILFFGLNYLINTKNKKLI